MHVEARERGGESVDYYDSEYRRQYCRERIAGIRDEYRRVQIAPRSTSQRRGHILVAVIRSIRPHVRWRAAQRVPA
jgi:hypothetical protein